MGSSGRIVGRVKFAASVLRPLTPAEPLPQHQGPTPSGLAAAPAGSQNTIAQAVAAAEEDPASASHIQVGCCSAASASHIKVQPCSCLSPDLRCKQSLWLARHVQTGKTAAVRGRLPAGHCAALHWAPAGRRGATCSALRQHHATALSPALRHSLWVWRQSHLPGCDHLCHRAQPSCGAAAGAQQPGAGCV